MHYAVSTMLCYSGQWINALQHGWFQGNLRCFGANLDMSYNMRCCAIFGAKIFIRAILYAFSNSAFTIRAPVGANKDIIASNCNCTTRIQPSSFASASIDLSSQLFCHSRTLDQYLGERISAKLYILNQVCLKSYQPTAWCIASFRDIIQPSVYRLISNKDFNYIL